MLLPRGGASNVFDLYNVTTERFEDTSLYLQPNQETLTTGAMYAYDGGDYVYIHVPGPLANSGRILRLNVAKMRIDGSFQLAGFHGAALIGNRMEIVTDASGNDYLYVAQHTGTLLWRAVLLNI